MDDKSLLQEIANHFSGEMVNDLNADHVDIRVCNWYKMSVSCSQGKLIFKGFGATREIDLSNPDVDIFEETEKRIKSEREICTTIDELSRNLVQELNNDEEKKFKTWTKNERS